MGVFRVRQFASSSDSVLKGLIGRKERHTCELILIFLRSYSVSYPTDSLIETRRPCILFRARQQLEVSLYCSSLDLYFINDLCLRYQYCIMMVGRYTLCVCIANIVVYVLFGVQTFATVACFLLGPQLRVL